MTRDLAIALVGTLGFALAAIGAYAHLRRQAPYGLALVRMAATAAIAANLITVGTDIARMGPVPALRLNYDSTLLLATLIGLVGMGTHLTRTLRGLDGFLFLGAALAQAGSFATADTGGVAATDRVWFISHGLAFAVSGALFVASGGAGIAYLMVHRMLRRKTTPGLLGNVASLESLERFGRWTPIIGFPLFTYGVLTGLCGVAHRRDIGRTAWYLDPSFLASLIVWATYAYLCVSLMYRPRIRGRRAATLASYGLAMVVVVFIAREFLSPMHQ